MEVLGIIGIYKMLRKVSFLGSCPEGLEQAFDECWHLKEITVPAAEVEKYRTAMPKYVDIIQIGMSNKQDAYY